MPVFGSALSILENSQNFVSMAYVNPLHIFQIQSEKEPTTAELRLAKKRALAEFDLNQQPSIKFQDVDLTRSEVIALFDGLARPAEAGWYWQLSQNRDLEAFLKQNGKDVHPPENWGPLEDAQYRDWIGAWMIPAIQQSFTQAVESQQVGGTRSLFEALPHFSRGQQTEMLRPVLEALQTMTDRLRFQIANIPKEKDLAQAIVYATAPYLAILHNHLPEAFYSHREAYAQALQALAKRFAEENRPQRWMAALHEAVLALDLPSRHLEPSRQALLALAADGRIWHNHLESWIAEHKPQSKSNARERSNAVLGCMVILVIVAFGFWAINAIVPSCTVDSVIRAISPMSDLPKVSIDTVYMELETASPILKDSVAGPKPVFPPKPALQ